VPLHARPTELATAIEAATQRIPSFEPPLPVDRRDRPRQLAAALGLA
jgi:hypothetical protein